MPGQLGAVYFVYNLYVWIQDQFSTVLPSTRIKVSRRVAWNSPRVQNQTITSSGLVRVILKV